MNKSIIKIFTLFVFLTILTGCKFSPSSNVSNSNKSDLLSDNISNSISAQENLAASLEIDVSGLKSNDGQPLILPLETKAIPKRPDNPLSLPENNPLHWFDSEYVAWDVTKINLPISPRNGAIGRKIVMIVAGDHPYWTATGIGAKKIADVYNMNFKVLSANYDLNIQNQIIERTINERPEMILLVAIDAKASVQQAKKINDAGIPLIMFNTIPATEAFQYSLAFTGPDDWGQFRLLARIFADRLGKKGGVAYLTHIPGGSPYFSRMMGPITELTSYAPLIETLDIQSPGFDAVKAKQVVSDWITRFGKNLKGIVCADDSSQILGAIDACKSANRSDIIIVAAGNSKIGMNAINVGDIYASTYQSAEADGATPVKLAADWFNGKQIPTIAYLPKRLITKDDVQKYLPAQW